MENFISKISKLVDQKDLPVILSALRQNNAIWEKLQNIEFSQHAIEYAGSNTEKWSPAAMALLAVGETADFGSLNAEDFNPGPSDLLPKAEEALKQFSDHPGSVSPNHTLEEAALVALALREKRRRSGSWKGLFDGLEIDDSLPWKTAFACLFSITPDPVESFYELANTTSAKAIPELFINAILSQPIHPDTQAEIIYEGIGRIQGRMQVDLVNTLDRQRPALAKTIAAQLITDRKIIHETSPELLDSFDDQLFQAVLHQVAGDFTEADHMLRLAWKTFEDLQVDVTSKMALAAFHQQETDFAAKTIDGISTFPGNSATPVPAYLLAQLRAGNPKDLKSLTDAPVHPTDPHPIEFLVAAQSESDQGDQKKAKNAVLDGYERAIEIIDHEPASLLDHLPFLVEKLIEFELYPQAFNILGTLLEQSPTDPDLLVNMGLASCHNHLPHLAIQNAALAAALEPEAVDIRRGHAKMLSAARQWEAASVELEHIIRMQKDPSPNDLFMHVDCLIHAGSTDQAIRSAESLIEREPESGLAHTMLAEAQLLNGKQAEAQESFTKAIQSSPQLARPWLKRLSLLEESGKHLEALSVVEEALASVSNDLQLHAAGGRIHRTLDRKVDAVQSFSQAAQALSKQSFNLESGIEEDCISVYENLMAFGKFSLASEFIEKAVEIFPGHPGLIHAFARMQIENGELETALSHLKSLTALDAVDVEVLLDIARTNMETGDDLAHTKSTIETALNNDPDNPIGLVLKAHAENTNDSSMELIRVYKEAIDDPEVTDRYWQKYLTMGFARSAINANQPEIAIDQLNAAAEMVGADRNLLQVLCQAYGMAGLTEDALASAKMIYKMDPQDIPTLEWFAERAIEFKAPDQAVEALKLAGENYKDNPRILMKIGQIYSQTGQRDSAITTYEKILKAKDINPSILHAIAKDILSIESPNAAVPFLQKAVQLSSSPNEAILKDLVSAQEQSKDIHGALITISDLLKAAPQDAALLQKKAEFELSLGKIEEAVISMDQSLTLDPGNVSLILKSAQLRRKMGDFTAAIYQYRRALKLDPNNSEASFQTADLLNTSLNPKEAWETINRRQFSIEELESIGANRAPKEIIHAFCLLVHLALEMGQIKSAEKILESAQSNHHPHVLALRSRIAAFHGSRDLASELLSQAKKALSAPEQDFGDETTIGVAAACNQANEWQTAISLIQEVAAQKHPEPYPHYLLAKNLVLQAEFQRECEAVKSLTMAPGADSLNEKTARLCENALNSAKERVSDGEAMIELSRWETRAALVFGKSVPRLNTDNDRESDIVEVAFQIRAQAQKGNRSEAIELAVQQREYPVILAALTDLLVDDDPDRAFEYASKLVDLDDAPMNLARLAFTAEQVGEKEKALESISSALVHQHDEPLWNTLAGKLNFTMGRVHAAAANLQKAIAYDPNLQEANIYLGKTHLAIGSYPEAVASFEIVEKQVPDQFDVVIGLGESHLKIGDTKTASKYLKKAAASFPDSYQPKLLEARLALGEGKADKALDYSDQALDLDPDNPEILAFRFEVLQKLGEPARALETIQKAIDLSQDPVPLMLQKADILFSSDVEGDGLEELQGIAEKYPSHPKVLTRLSMAMFETGDNEKAIEYSQKAIQLMEAGEDPIETSQLHFMLGKQLDEAGQLDQAIHHLMEAIDLAPNQADAYLEVARVHQKRRRPTEALGFYKKAAGLAPSDHRAFMESGLLYKEIKDFINAERMLRRAGDLAPKNADIQRHLAATITLNLVHPTKSYDEAAASA